MLLTEFDEEAFVKDIREERRKEGREEGLRESARRLLRKGKLSLLDIAESLELPLKEIEEIAENVKKKNSAKEIYLF